MRGRKNSKRSVGKSLATELLERGLVSAAVGRIEPKFAQLALKWVPPFGRSWAAMRIEVIVFLETLTSPIAGKRQATSPSCENDRTKG